jgi:hypothetical protein
MIVRPVILARMKATLFDGDVRRSPGNRPVLVALTFFAAALTKCQTAGPIITEIEANKEGRNYAD